VHSDLLPLSRSSVDRDAVARSDPDLLRRLAADPATRVVVVRGGEVAVTPSRDALELVPVARVPGGLPRSQDPASSPVVATPPDQPGTVAYLGREGGVSYVAVALPEAPGMEEPDVAGIAPSHGQLGYGFTWAGLREVGVALGDRDAGLAAGAVALAAWHARHRRCPVCGAPTAPANAGWTRRCTADGTEHYPRTDPAVIVAVVDDEERLLLAHNARWPVGRFSVVAGFVEPGESLEAAVRREVREECGLLVGDLVYLGSQPWPFPSSLMVAFRGVATGGWLAADGDEITEARFVARGDLAHMLRSGEVALPGPSSIAHLLIEDWYGRPLPSR
jgi:NAD+ diphosphatase